MFVLCNNMTEQTMIKRKVELHLSRAQELLEEESFGKSQQVSIKIKPSTRKGKRYTAFFSNGRRVHFGQAGASTYIDHKDQDLRSAYLARHSVGENWKDPYSAGALSRFLLWGKSTSLNINISNFKQKFRFK